jgi:hypothetical protein
MRSHSCRLVDDERSIHREHFRLLIANWRFLSP